MAEVELEGSEEENKVMKSEWKDMLIVNESGMYGL